MFFSPEKSDRKPDASDIERDGGDRDGNFEEVRRPFDTSDLDSIPGPKRDDPPYREWWVVDVPS